MSERDDTSHTDNEVSSDGAGAAASNHGTPGLSSETPAGTDNAGRVASEASPGGSDPDPVDPADALDSVASMRVDSADGDALALAAIQELSTEVEAVRGDLEQKDLLIKGLLSEVNTLRRKNEALSERVAALEDHLDLDQ